MKLDMLLGDCLDVLPTLEAGSVHCCVTSPPYWGLRDYQVDGQLGLEATPEEYVAKMVEVFRAVRRVLRDDATLWLNLGDGYNSNQGAGFNAHAKTRPHLSGDGVGQKRIDQANRSTVMKRPVGLKPKDLVGMPWRVAFALRADGWYLRSDIIWHKPNPMPESCTDRPTKSHEYLFLLTKSARYFYDSDAIREEADLSRVGQTQGRWGNAIKASRESASPSRLSSGGNEANGTEVIGGTTRNKRSVWTIATQPYPKSHFATFPEALVLPCILAGTSEEGCCAECGAPYVRVIDKPMPEQRASRPVGYLSPTDTNGGVGNLNGKEMASYRADNPIKTTGWEPTCKCVDAANRYNGKKEGLNENGLRTPQQLSHATDSTGCRQTMSIPPPAVVGACPVPCTVLDPFLGSGTTAKVAQQYGRSFVGCELSAEYLELARDRFKQSRLFA